MSDMCFMVDTLDISKLLLEKLIRQRLQILYAN